MDYGGRVMRTDGALLSRPQLQSTSGQQDFWLYPAIAVRVLHPFRAMHMSAAK